MSENKAEKLMFDPLMDQMKQTIRRYHYIRFIFNALREHKELLEQPDYKRLYDEVIEIHFYWTALLFGWDINEIESGYAVLETLSDLENARCDSKVKHPIEEVNCYLEKRKKSGIDPYIPIELQ